MNTLMKITKPGKYRVLNTITSCDCDCFVTIDPGAVLTITRIHPETGDVWGPKLCDFIDGDQPVESISNETLCNTQANTQKKGGQDE